MFLIEDLPRSGADLAAYRMAIVDVYDKPAFRRLCTDHIDKNIPKGFDFERPFEDVVEAVLARADEVGWLRRLLVLALRHRADHRGLVDRLAPFLGLGPLVALADWLSGTCSPEALAAAIQTLEQRIREQAPTHKHHDDRGLWIDRLVWLDEFPPTTHREPPLIQVLDRVLSSLGPQDPAVHPLREWLARMRRDFGLVAAPPAEVSASYAILLELTAGGPTWSVGVWRVSADGGAAHLFASELDAPEHEHELVDALVQVVDECFARSVVELRDPRLPPRFEFVLPRRWLGLAVDQLRVGGSEDHAPTRLARSFPVVVRPGMWCRPSPNVWPILQGRLARKRQRVQAGQHRVDVVAEPGAWGPSSVEDAQDDDSLAGLVLAFDDLSHAGSVVVQSLQTHVLAVLWPRSSCATACDEAGRQYLKSLIEGVRDAPARVFEARRAQDGIGKQFKDHLSLIWHGDPVDLPLVPLAVPPLQS